MTEYQLAAMDRAGEHGEPIFRAPSVGCSGETCGAAAELLASLRSARTEVRRLIEDSLCAAAPDRPFCDVLDESNRHPALLALDEVITKVRHA